MLTADRREPSVNAPPIGMSEREKRVYRLLNPFVARVLRSPAHAVLSRRVMLLTFTGRRSGRRYTVPISYLRLGETIVGFTSSGWSAWWPNLRGGASVQVRLAGRRRSGSAEAITDDRERVATWLDAFVREFPRTAPRYGVELGPDDEATARGVRAAVAHGRAVLILIRLTPA